MAAWAMFDQQAPVLQTGCDIPKSPGKAMIGCFPKAIWTELDPLVPMQFSQPEKPVQQMQRSSIRKVDHLFLHFAQNGSLGKSMNGRIGQLARVEAGHRSQDIKCLWMPGPIQIVSEPQLGKSFVANGGQK
jgi:hypothetical protein